MHVHQRRERFSSLHVIFLKNNNFRPDILLLCRFFLAIRPFFGHRHTEVVGHGASIMVTRQRPQIMFADDGTTPKHMFIGGSFNETNRETIRGVERTFVFEFNVG